jgi:magnesium transporter
MAPDTAAELEVEPWKQLHALIEAEDADGLDNYLHALEPTERVRALSRLDADECAAIVLLITPERAADIIEDLPDAHAADLIERIDAGQAADILEELSSDQGADLLAGIPTENAEAILVAMGTESADRVRQLITYPEDVAGGLMGTEEYASDASATVADFLEGFRANKEDRGYLPQRIVLIDAHRQLVGAVDVAEVLLAERETRLSELSQPVVPVSDYADLDQLEDYFDRYETLGAPVVNANGQLVGRLRRRAVYDALADRAQEDQLKVQGIVSGEELRSMALFTRSRRRLAWLSINIVLNILAASVIAYFQDTVAAVIALAVFLPIVSDMSGCSGNQAVAVSLRELTLGVVSPRDAFRVWLKEVSVGLLNGLALGVLIGIVTYLWMGNVWLGLVVGLALALNTVIAVSIGGTVPLLLKRFRADPAVASGPVLTTITDMCGFFLVLGLATLALPLLT